MTSPDRTDAAKLYDVRYSRYEGLHEARWRSVLALARSSATRALGLRRTPGAKVWPFLLVLLAFLPVVAAIGIPLLVPVVGSPQEVLSYADLVTTLIPITVAFAATTLPSLLTRERRDRVLSLYFATAVSPTEYVLGKVLAALALMSLVGLAPLVVLFLGTILTADAPLQQLGDDIGGLPGVLGGGLVIAVYYAAVGLLAGSLTGKRVFAVGGMLAVLLVTPVLSGLAFGFSDNRDLLALDLALTPIRAAATLLPGRVAEDQPPSAAIVWAVVVVVVLVATAVLAARYDDGDST